MRAILQRVSQASVSVDGQVTGAIAQGLLVLLGMAKGDTAKDADYLVEKVTHLRIFQDSNGKMNLSILDIGGEILVVSQFTLYADCRKGRRPSFDQAAPPEDARRLYDYFLAQAALTGLRIAAGVFQADMRVSLTNMGPVTLIVESDHLK